MKLKGKTILITGGSEGVGLELARALIAGNTVIACARSAAKLERARAELPGLHTFVCDITDTGQRRTMVRDVLQAHRELDVLINNAGGRRRVNLAGDSSDVLDAALQHDLALDFVAPAALCIELLEQLRSRPEAAIINVTTGLVYLPKASQPFYCAAKAALHSYTRSLRLALAASNVSVHEALLPLVATHFHQGELPTTIRALTASDAAGRILQGVAREYEEIHVGKAWLARWFEFFAPRHGMWIMNR
jgi:uncharacterized oxidoreductase